MTKNPYYSGPTVSVPVTTKRQGLAMVRWLANRGILARYSGEDRMVWAPVTKHGDVWTRKALILAQTQAEAKL